MSLKEVAQGIIVVFVVAPVFLALLAGIAVYQFFTFTIRGEPC